MTPVEYRRFAADCGRWACRARDSKQSDILMSLTSVWEAAALRKEKQIRHELEGTVLAQLLIEATTTCARFRRLFNGLTPHSPQPPSASARSFLHGARGVAAMTENERRVTP